MAKQRRAFTSYPDYLKTPHNDQETYVADDMMYEPENADFHLGYIGSGDNLTPLDLERTPLLQEKTAEQQKYQLSIGATYIEPAFQQRESAAFYTDLVGQIEANGGLVSDQNRIFETDYYAWTPPIDYDKHMNFSRYFWIVDGEAADIHGVYITKEPQASKTSIYEYDGSEFNRIEVPIEDGLPVVGASGDYVEDASNKARPIYRSNGTNWVVVEFLPVDDIPSDTSAFSAGDTVYVTRTGPEFNRPLVWMYSEQAKRWIAQSVVVSLVEPDTPREGMVWEDPRIKPQRKFKVYQNGLFTDLDYTNSFGPSGIGTDKQHVYDVRNFFDSVSISDAKDPWARENWWRHYEDLSPTDRAVLLSEDQAVRPLIEFWNGIESADGDSKDERNDPPVYKKYSYNLTPDDVTDTGETTTIYQYQVGTGRDDIVLGFPLEFNDTGEFLFELTLESDESEALGYKYFRDTVTGLTRSIWAKADEPLSQEVDDDGLYDVPRSLSSNPDHVILTEFSRSKILNHMFGVIGAQDDATGSATGPNGYRWSVKNPANGSTLIDSEQTLLRTMATLQTIPLDFPSAIRTSSRVYQKTLSRFTTRMNQMWEEDNKLADATGTLLVTTTEAVDAVLTELFAGRTGDFPYAHSDMGTYLETRVDDGTAIVVNAIDPKPIFIPPSPPKVGSSPAYLPTTYVDTQGTTILRGHEGYVQSSFGDDRDLMWLDLQERFFAEVPEVYKTEDTSFSSRQFPSNFFLTDYYGNATPLTVREPVDEVVEDYTAIVSPTLNQRVFSTGHAVFANYDGSTWLLTSAVVDDIFLNNDDGEYYIYNGKSTSVIELFNNDFDFDYSDGEYRRIIQNEFSRLIILGTKDPTDHDDFEESDKFTWNYRSAGVEGNYRGQYRRLYNTIEPQIHSWEVVGYSIEPDWWTTEYVPDSVASDGTPRYGNAHQMWSDFQQGIVNPITGEIREEYVMTAPIPVDDAGELLDPIAANIVEESSLDYDRIDDSWQYGDGASVEQSFYDSAVYPYTVSLASYLMKNGRWVDLTWVGQTLSIGDNGTNNIATAPHFVNEETLTRPNNDELPVHLQQDEDGNVLESIGTNAWISDSVLAGGGSPTNDFGKIVDNTESALIWQTSGFINHKRTIITTLSNTDIPFEDIHTLLHTSQTLDRKFSSGVIIERESPSGYRIYGTDPSNPVFEIDRPAVPTAAGQFERRESFETGVDHGDSPEARALVEAGDKHIYITDTLELPFNTLNNEITKVSILVDGQRIKSQHIRITSNHSFEIENNVEMEDGMIVTATILATTQSPSAQMRSFKVKGIPFSYFPNGTGERITVEYGRFFETSTEVINFMLGYGRALDEDGWVFSDMDEETNEQVDWMTGAKRFATWVVATESIWNPRKAAIDVLDQDRFTFSPMVRKSEYVAEFGLTNNIESVQNGYYGIVDSNRIPIDSQQTFVSRSNEATAITATGDTEIYGIRINLVEMQHVVVFSNITKFNDIIYDPVLSLVHSTLRVDSYRTNDWTGRPEADGYVIDGSELLPNFEKQAFDFTRFYDRINTPDNPELRESARNLYGWTPNDEYMDFVGAADRTRFDYFRGMLNAKGTVRAVNAYTKGTILGADNVFIYEDWAWKVQKFGDENRLVAQFNVDANEFRDDIQVIGFGAVENVYDNILEVQDFDRSNSAIGTAADPTYTTADFVITNESNTLNFVTSGGVLTAIVDEINAAIDNINMVGVNAFIYIKDNSEFLGFHNTGDFIGTEYTLIAGTINDLLAISGVEPGTYTIDNDRWIIPAPTGQSGLSNVEFPVDEDGLPVVEDTTYLAQIFDTTRGFTLTKSPQYDPELGKFDPIGLAGVDYTEQLDPARYNSGPEAENSNGLAWGNNQVGEVWWDISNRSYVDYRRPIDGSDPVTFPNGADYQSAASVWGNLEFYRAYVTREDDVATVQTLDIFSKEPVVSGLSSGDIISIRNAQEPEWNVTDVTISLGPVEVTGTIPYVEEEAAGTVYIPSSITISGSQLDSTNETVGTNTFNNNNSVSGNEDNPIFQSGDNFEIRTRDGNFTFTSADGGTVIGLVQEINQFFVDNGIDNQVETFNDFDTLQQVNRLAFRNPGQVTCGSGEAYELIDIGREVVGSVGSPTFSAGDAFSFTTDSDSYGFSSSAGGSVSTIVTEINDRFDNPPSGKNQIVEIEAFNSGGRLGFRNTASFPGVKYLLVVGTPTDLLAVAGIDEGTYGGILEIADVADGVYEIIPGEDFSGVGTGADFSLVLFKDLLTKSGIDITSTSSKERTGATTTGTVVDPVYDIDDALGITVHQAATPSTVSNGTAASIATLVSDINDDLQAANITAIQAVAVGNKLRFENAVPGEEVVFDLDDTGGLLAKAFIDTGSYTEVTGSDDITSYLSSDYFDIEVDIEVPIVVSSTTLDDVVSDINDELTTAGITSVSASNNADRLEFTTTGNEYTLFSSKRLNYINQRSSNLETVVADINTLLGDTDITEVNAFFSEDSLGFQNSIGNEGVSYMLISGTQDDLLTITGIDIGASSELPDPYDSVFSGNTGVALEIIPSGYSFDIATAAVASTTGPYTTTVSTGIDELVEDINSYLSDEGIEVVTAQNIDSVVVFTNTAGNGGAKFQLIEGTPDDLLDWVGISTITGFFEIIASLSDFTIETDSSGPQYFSSADGGNLDDVVVEINDFLDSVTITEVEALAEASKLILRNTLGNEGKRFTLTAGTVDDLLAQAGISAQTYGSYPSGSNFDITTETTGVPITFTTANGGTLDNIVSEINTFFASVPIPEVEAVNEDDFLKFKNTNDYIGKSYELEDGSPAPSHNLLDLTGITPDTYTTDLTKFTFEITTLPSSPATGDVKVVVGTIDVYEWVESPVPPENWVDYTNTLTAPDHQTGVPLNEDDPSYVEVEVYNQFGQLVPVYYFWVEGNTGINPRAELTTVQVGERLTSPTLAGSSWFAPMDANYMALFTGGVKILDEYAIEVSIDRRVLETHAAWVLVSEGDQFKEVPSVITNKIIDSMSGIDKFGTTVPSPLLSDYEKYGSCEFPVQTIYSDVDSAIGVYLETLNAILRQKNLGPLDALVAIFNLDDEFNETTNPEGFWEREDFLFRQYEDQPIFDKVVTIAVRDFRGANGFYATGDLIQVDQTNNVDPFEEAIGNTVVVGATYLFQEGLFLEVGIENHTISINSNVQNDSDVFRSVYQRTYDALDRGEQNALVFSLLHEMMRQHLNADWFIKTSYISTQVFDVLVQSAYVRPDETQGIINNIADVKPFRSKLRSATSTMTLDTIEDVPVFIQELPNIKIGLRFDRLSCNLIDDGGWDSYAWDQTAPPAIGWDFPLWDMAELGTDEWYIVGIEEADGAKTSYTFDNPADNPPLYDQRVIIRDQFGNTVDNDAVGVTITTFSTYIDVDLDSILPNGSEVELQQTHGFVERNSEITLGVEFEDTAFEAIKSTYKHHVARTLRTGAIGFDPRTQGYTSFIGDGSETTYVVGNDVSESTVVVIVSFQLQEFGVDYTVTDPGTSDAAIEFTTAPSDGAIIVVQMGGIIGMYGCTDLNDDSGGRPEERIVTEVIDSVNICVTNTTYELMGSWDSTPWDTTGWDQPPLDIGNRIFIISVGSQDEIDPGLEIFPVDEDYTSENAPYVIGTDDSYVLIEVLVDSGSGFETVTEGVEYVKVEPFNNTLEFGSPDGQQFIGDGATITYNVTIPTGTKQVLLDGVVLNEGVDYLLSGTNGNETLDFSPIQPNPPSHVIDVNFSSSASSIVASGATFDFEINLPRTSLTRENMFVFKNAVYENSCAGVCSPTYTVGVYSGDVTFDLAPNTDDEIILFGFGNSSIVDGFDFDGDGATTDFTVGSEATLDNTIVYVDDVYQVPNADYAVLSSGDPVLATISFAVAPPVGVNNVEITVQDDSPLFSIINYTGNNIFTSFTIGNITDGENDAFDETVLVFLDGVYQNPNVEYTISNQGTPTASVDFATAPPGTVGGNIEIRVIDSPVDNYDVVESTWEASGNILTGQDTIPGVIDALDPDNIMIFLNGVVQDLYTAHGTPDLTLLDGDKIQWPLTSVPSAGDVISFRMFRYITLAQDLVVLESVPLSGSVVDVSPNPYLVSGDIVKYIYNGWNVGPLGPFEVISVPGPYDVVDGVLILDDDPTLGSPPDGTTITVEYKESRSGDFKQSILTRMPIMVADILEDHLTYDDPLGFETNRLTGTKVVDETLVEYFQWDGSVWNSIGPVNAGDQFYVGRKQEIVGYNGSEFITLFSVGDSYVTPPLLDYPAYGRGVTYGTYAYGTAEGAETQWSEAYEIMQHPGDCD